MLAELERRHRRVLSDNPEGCALVKRALEDALVAGVQAQCGLDGIAVDELEAGEGAWDAWRRARDETPESERWPDTLARTDPEAVRHAAAALGAAAAELDVRTRERRDLEWHGEQCAEAGAALVRSLRRQAQDARACSLKQPRWARWNPTGRVEWRWQRTRRRLS